MVDGSMGETLGVRLSEQVEEVVRLSGAYVGEEGLGYRSGCNQIGGHEEEQAIYMVEMMAEHCGGDGKDAMRAGG